MLDKLLHDLKNNGGLIEDLENAGKKLADADPSLTVEDLRKKALNELGYDFSDEEINSLFVNTSPDALDLDEMAQVVGGGRVSRSKPWRYISEPCPVHGDEGHLYHADGQSRPTSNIFYDTEEHYVCDCGKGYWDAGFFSSKTWD